MGFCNQFIIYHLQEGDRSSAVKLGNLLVIQLYRSELEFQSLILFGVYDENCGTLEKF